MAITEPISHQRVHHHVERLRKHLEQLRIEYGPRSPAELPQSVHGPNAGQGGTAGSSTPTTQGGTP